MVPQFHLILLISYKSVPEQPINLNKPEQPMGLNTPGQLVGQDKPQQLVD